MRQKQNCNFDQDANFKTARDNITHFALRKANVLIGLARNEINKYMTLHILAWCYNKILILP